MSFLHLRKTKITIGTLLFVILFAGPFIYYSNAQTPESDRAKLEAELRQYEAEIVQLEAELSKQKSKSGTLKGDIGVLTAQINKAKTAIKARALAIVKLTGEINEKNKTINVLSNKIDIQKESLAQLLRKTNELDNTSLVHLIFSRESLSEFYADVDSFASVQDSVKTSVDQITTNKKTTEIEKEILSEKQDKELDTKAELEKAKREVERSESEKQQLLKLSKNKEKEYQDLVAERAKKVAEIKSRLFKFAGGSTKAIQFGTALGYAEEIQKATNIEPSFVLAILTQESNLGSNVGKCYLTNTSTGVGVNINTGRVWPNLMKASRDVKPFLDITGRLGMDPLKTVVSCPIEGIGYGGAMGPAQFIPSTWKGVESRIKSIVGGMPNPWSPKDAITASALYLSDLGAGGTSYASQIRAACRYYGSGGSTCSYGRSVMNLKAKIQDDIDYLKQYGVSRR